MDFPVYQAPFAGNGTIIGVNAVVHVFLSHGVAIGCVAMLALADWAVARGYLADDETTTRFLKRFLRFTVVTVTIAGAVTGAGIWFTTNALAPRGIASMLRLFFWPWFVEWIAFVAEVAVLIVYYYRWNEVGAYGRQRRAALAVLYALIVIASATLITGILGFMLTPGGWPWTRRFAAAYFNPSFPPQLAARVLFGLAIGALLAIAFALPFRRDDRFISGALRLFGLALLVTVPLLLLALVVYGAVIPEGFRTWTRFAVLTSRLSQAAWLMAAANALAVLLVLALATMAVKRRAAPVSRLIAPALVVSFLFVAEFERAREFIRGPYLMPGYMYANEVLMAETPAFEQAGMLANSRWYGVAAADRSVLGAGAYLFARNCSVCHTIGGVNGIGARAKGRSEGDLFVITGRTNQMVPFMPPFSGTVAERRVLARFLHELASGRVRIDSRGRMRPEADRP